MRTIALALLLATTSASAAPRPIKPRDLKHAIASTTIASLRSDEPDVEKAAFREKMKLALRSPLHLKQTFPGLLGTMTKDLVGSKKLPGKVVPIGFDAHVENAGTVRIGHKRAIQTLVDFDDSGVGPAGIDALSIGTALVQAGYGKKVMKKAYSAFAEAAVGNDLGPREVKAPKWGKLARRWLADNTKTVHGKPAFKGLPRASAKTAKVIEHEAAGNDVLSHYDIVDVAKSDPEAGGSGGLVELMLLARDKQSGETRVFVAKEQEHPGADELGIDQPSNKKRLRMLEHALWRDVPPGVFFYMHDVKLPGDKKMDLLVRDKFDVIDDVAQGKSAAHTAVDVARLYGREHAGQFGKASADELAHWMEKSTVTLSNGFDTLWEKLKRER